MFLIWFWKKLNLPFLFLAFDAPNQISFRPLSKRSHVFFQATFFSSIQAFSKMASFVSVDVANLILEIANKVEIHDHAGLTAIKAYLDTLAVAAAPVAPAAPATPTKKTAPVAPDAPKKKRATKSVIASVEAITVAPTEDDPLRNHKYRLQTINPALCMGRKLDLKNQIVGTRKDDEGSNGIFWPEKQCTKAPESGEKLCRFCKEKDDDVKAGKAADKHWFGRLDEPIFYKACVVGCGDFFQKYPAGIPSDPSTAPPAGYSVKAPGGAIAAKKRGPKPKTDSDTDSVVSAKPAAAPAPSAATAAAPATTKTKTTVRKPKASVAKTTVAPIEAAWVVFMFEGRTVARSTKNNYVYEVDTDSMNDDITNENVASIVKKDDYIGVWKNGAVDAYDMSGAMASDNEDDA
jgi:hypothetical protein